MPKQRNRFKEVNLFNTHTTDTGVSGIAFCYPEEGPIVIKGHWAKVRRYIKSNLTMCHYKFVVYKNGIKQHGHWWINGDEWNIDEHKTKGFVITKSHIEICSFKKVPLRYIKEFSKHRANDLIYSLYKEGAIVTQE